MSKVYRLIDNQARAVDPADSVWLSASAGTGKTQVLSARVLRLLLTPGVRPENILCLTFTKAGAAEMAERVNAVLARWVRLDDTLLEQELYNIGASTAPESRERARTLFASVLDCPGGGLRIDTIHAFAQWLLAAFPEEAGLIPGTRPMEDRDRDLLAHNVLADLLVDWETHAETGLLLALEGLTLRFGPDKTRAWLMRCAGARELWLGHGAWQEPLKERVELLLGLEPGAGPESAEAFCDDALFDFRSVARCLELNRAWGTLKSQGPAGVMEAWLAADKAGRLQTIDALANAVFTNAGEIRSKRYLEKLDPDYASYAERVRDSLTQVLHRRQLLELVKLITPALTVGRRFALAWEEAKQREGFVDFDDLIRTASRLLDSENGRWIAYKLDRQFDHVLVDEAQDTNKSQWSIIEALTDEFFSGVGQHDNKLRTIFVVGDYKQAIFGFQGTSPENFEIAKGKFDAMLQERAQNASTLRDGIRARELAKLGLGQSYRTSQPVLDFVDEAIEAIGGANFGLAEAAQRHFGYERAGLVTLWKPVDPKVDDADDDPEDMPDTWLSEPQRRMADKIAAQIKGMIGTFALEADGGRMARPGDFMVLVRKRAALAGLVVARLHALGVPVAGVDRLRLDKPLAVRDLMAALRFAAQPLDDLNLACLLVSPLVGWTQDQLLEHGHRPERVSLWDHLRDSRHPDVAELQELLKPLLARADYELPQALIQWLLVGPWKGRSKLVSRLGLEANDPINELVNAALAYASSHAASLQGFIRWFDAGEGELKRDAGASGGLVRVMTVHGSKGLQAPIVILADATGNPESAQRRGLALKDPFGEREVPVPDLNKDELVGPLAIAGDDAKAVDLQEHWRLLYVAMTRAEEALFIGGALNKKETAPAPDSWYARLLPLMGGDPMEDGDWGHRFERGTRAVARARSDEAAAEPLPALPSWAVSPVGPEPRPPRPLTPSSAGEELGSDPPLPPGALAAAARRGVLIHKLLERLPDIPADEREAKGRAWLDRSGADLSHDDREDVLNRSLAVLADNDWEDLFSPAALAEVPLAAIVGGQVIAGTADRLLVTGDRVLVADFKTARRPPASLEEVPTSTLRQMAAYVAALSAIYPGRRIEAAVLYTQTPRLIPLPAELLDQFAPAFN